MLGVDMGDMRFEGFRRLVTFVKPGRIMVIWLYSVQRRLSNFFLNKLRIIVRPLPNNLLYALAFTLAIPDFILAKSLKMVARHWLRNFFPTHFRLYEKFPFRVSWADWFDRLGAPIRRYYTKPELDAWISHVNGGFWLEHYCECLY
jgi:hypothetical protein